MMIVFPLVVNISSSVSVVTYVNVFSCYSIYRKFDGSRDLALNLVQLLKKVIGQSRWQNAR